MTTHPTIPIWILDQREQQEDMDQPRDLDPSPEDMENDDDVDPYVGGNPDPTRPYRLRTQDHTKDGTR